jgi:uncharacterized protein (TIGR00251 family)
MTAAALGSHVALQECYELSRDEKTTSSAQLFACARCFAIVRQAIREDTMTARLEVYVQPRASKTQVAGVHDGRIKIRLAAPPVDGAANAELVSFVASRLGIAKSKVRVVAGEASRRKVVEVEGVDEATLRRQLGIES